MNSGFSRLVAARPQDRRDVFLGAARRLGTPEQNVEKDFWVAWTLDVLFNGLPQGPRLLFKGGTSLSKAYGLIPRFSEDIDITVFREDLGQPASVEELEALSRKKRESRLDAIKSACRKYIQETLRVQFAQAVTETLAAAGIRGREHGVSLDPDDPDGQSILFRYPAVSAESDGYVRPAVKIEAGAKSALDPHETRTIRPYVAEEVPGLPLDVPNVTAVVAERTFWDKVVILHGVRKWFENRGVLRHQGQRVSRHYCDVHWLLRSEAGKNAVADRALAADCAAHARMFFNSPALQLDTARHGSFSLVPSGGMAEQLRRDYRRMEGMVIGPAPEFNDVIASIVALESALNRAEAAAGRSRAAAR